jgi:hypothetical protein
MKLRTRLAMALVAAVGLLGSQFSTANAVTKNASTPATAGSAATKSAGPATPASARLADPGTMLPNGWQHSSDEAVTVVGDGTGLHVLAASEASGYAWRSVATLGDPAVQTSLWIGQACMTNGGSTAVVVYAPQQVTNMAGAQGVLGRAAVVDLHTGAVKDLGGGFSIAYFDPGCGTGNTAVLTEGGWANDTGNAPMSTTLAVVDTTAGRIASTVRVPGQVTSAVPYQGQIAAADGQGLEEISGTGTTRLLAATATVPYQLAPDASGGLGYQTVAGKSVNLWHLAAGQAHQVASVAEGSVELRQTGGRVWLVGPDAAQVQGLPAQWQAVDAPVVATPSSTGTVVVSTMGSITAATGKDSDPTKAQPVGIAVRLTGGSHQSATFEVPTTAAPAKPSAVEAGGRDNLRAAPATAGSPTTPVSVDRTCAIPVDDPHIQAYQPTFQQVEWAADQAVQGSLTNTRPSGLYGSSLVSYTPQGMFPLPPVAGGGSLPAQVLLGVLTQESNLQQASVHVIQGQTSNPLTSFNWYGNWIDGDTVNTGLVNWSASDCGSGIAQITSGMCLAQGQGGDRECQYGTPLPFEDQLAVAVDYQANIAAGAQFLIQDWNQLWNDGIQPNNLASTTSVPTSDPKYVENWYMALWAYNSGLEPGTLALGNTTGCTPAPSCTDGNGDWGLGYADNPINPAYPPDRPTFEDPGSNPGPGGATYSRNWDLSHPQYWPYEDKVLAFAFDSATLFDYSQGKAVQAFAWADGSYNAPFTNIWCTSANHCDTSNIDPTQPTGPDACQLTGNYADHCWWHIEPQARWAIEVPSLPCMACGLQQLTYAAGAPSPAAEPIAAKFAQTCTESPLPSNAVIVGDGGQAALGCPGQNWTSVGSFTWNFARDANGNYSSKIDFDQIGAGFGGHFWFGYTLPNNNASASSGTPAPGYGNQVITGTWTPPSSVAGWTDIKVAIPSYGDNATNAIYRVDPGGGLPTRNVRVDQTVHSGTNSWIDLGDFYLASGAHVSLSNVVSLSGQLGVDIEWDAAAFITVSNPQVNYVAMGDSYSSGEGVTPYFLDSDTATDQCHRSQVGYPMLVTLPGQTQPIAQTTPTGFGFIACSGAETTGVAPDAINVAGGPNAGFYAVNTNENTYNAAGNTDWGTVQNPPNGPIEGLQANNSELTTSTALVTISSGGNDSRFADVMYGCLSAAFVVTGVQDCSASNWVLTRNSNNATDPQPLNQFEPVVINYLTAHLVQTYLDINAKAPSADIVVVGYPLVFPTNPTTSCDSGSIAGKVALLSPSAQNMLNQFGTDLNTAISQAVAQVKNDGVAIRYVDPQQAFTGHALCGGDPWFLPLSLTSASSSYHPTQAGQQAYGTLVSQCLAGKLAC